MGGCIVADQKKSRKSRLSPLKQGSKVITDSQLNSPTKTGESLQHQSSMTIQLQPQSSSYVSENAEDNEISDEQWRRNNGYVPSVVIKMPNRDRLSGQQAVQLLRNSTGNSSSLVSQMIQSEEILGHIHQESDRQSMTLTLSNRIMNIQFQLPKAGAGPLVVPYIQYHKYNCC